MKRPSFAGLLFGLPLLVLASALPAETGFVWTEEPGKHADLAFNGRKIARYVHERIDESSPARREETYKPFHHLFDAGGNLITKGPGGKFPHHRGIYYGFSKCRIVDAEGKETTADTWHCSKAFQTHEKTLTQSGGADAAVQTVLIDWHDNQGRVFLHEKRELVFRLEAGGDLVIDFNSALTLAEGTPKVILDGDPQHAGFQFRAGNEVAESTAKETYYTRPGTGRDAPGKTVNWDAKNDNETTANLPWKAVSFVLGGQRHSVAYLDRAENPKPARFSERDYARFGSYFVAEVLPERPVTVRYRLVVRQGEFTAEEVEGLSKRFAAE